MKTYLKQRKAFRDNQRGRVVRGVSLKQVYEILDYKTLGLYQGFLPTTYKDYLKIKKQVKGAL